LVGEVTSDSNGNYSIPLLPGAYTLQFRDDAGTDYLGQYYDQETEANATPITVGMADVTGKNAALELGGSLSGRVTDALTGLGVPNATVYLDPLDGNPPATAEADANGFYTVHSILPGSYSVRYDLEGINGIAYDYATQYWNNHSEESDSDPVTFASGTRFRRSPAPRPSVTF
jgi:hypothetical protein